ncbi:MAG: aconitate hydratase [Oscillospiraceae bacterium]|nr:aconitate hydratase [Oscillospiraceae bacterium]
MGLNAAQKILSAHLVDGVPGGAGELGLKVDRTLTQDSTGTMAYLEFEALGVERVKTELSVAYVDHNILQTGFENADDHEYIRTVAKKHGILFSRPGNGICHQVNLERFSAPGKILIGSDSHTPTAGGAGMLAFGAGGLDVAVAMGGGAYYIADPKIVGVELKGRLSEGVSAKDVILELLRRLTVKGGVGKIIEYFGEGVKTLGVPERATICNMGAELGATSSIFPSDEITREFFKAQGREADFTELSADADASYDELISLDLSVLEPLAACPHMPDRIKPVSELEGLKIDQVCIGSCTNSSLLDMLKVAAILKGKTIAETVNLTISPGSRQVLDELARLGALSDILNAGARVLECACGPCIGMGQAPKSGAVSLRTFNRNFEGRSGTADAQVYLVSPETAAASALAGCITDPREAARGLKIELPASFTINDNLISAPASAEAAGEVEVVRGPNIKPFPVGHPCEGDIAAEVTLKVGDNITTDHIMPSGSSLLPYRSNIPYLSGFCFSRCDEGFPERARKAGQGIIIGGENYGQGSSREHAALAPLALGVRAVIAKSFARIHRDNLVNAGIAPLEFADASDYENVALGEKLSIKDIGEALNEDREELEVFKQNGGSFKVKIDLTARRRAILLAGGLLNYTKKTAGEERT